MITPPWNKDINLGRYNTAIRLCADVPRELPEGQRPKPNQL